MRDYADLISHLKETFTEGFLLHMSLVKKTHGKEMLHLNALQLKVNEIIIIRPPSSHPSAHGAQHSTIVGESGTLSSNINVA